VDLDVPPNFWTRLAGKYGTKSYWQDNGEEASIANAVSAIDTCFREEPGRFKCAKIQARSTYLTPVPVRPRRRCERRS
jgi:hypothetical protein